MKKIITVTNRDLVRRFKFYRDQLTSGTVDKIVVPVNGVSIAFILEKKREIVPGDIRPLIEKMRKAKRGYNITRPRFRNNIRTI